MQHRQINSGYSNNLREFEQKTHAWRMRYADLNDFLGKNNSAGCSRKSERLTKKCQSKRDIIC